MEINLKIPSINIPELDLKIEGDNIRDVHIQLQGIVNTIYRNNIDKLILENININNKTFKIEYNEFLLQSLYKSIVPTIEYATLLPKDMDIKFGSGTHLMLYLLKNFPNWVKKRWNRKWCVKVKTKLELAQAGLVIDEKITEKGLEKLEEITNTGPKFTKYTTKEAYIIKYLLALYKGGNYGLYNNDMLPTFWLEKLGLVAINLSDGSPPNGFVHTTEEGKKYIANNINKVIDTKYFDKWFNHSTSDIVRKVAIKYLPIDRLPVLLTDDSFIIRDIARERFDEITNKDLELKS